MGRKENMEFTDTTEKPLQCRFCKETSNLGVWLYESEEPEKHFMCQNCWNFIASLIDQMLIPMLKENLHYAEDYLKKSHVIRGVRVEATTN
jgi:hypothetical protein